MLKVGQSWFYKDAIRQDSYCVINLIEEHKGEIVCHISVINVPIGDEITDILHMPFNESAVLSSLMDKMDDIHKIDESTLAAIEEWRMQNGGVWNVSVDEAVRVTLDALN